MKLIVGLGNPGKKYARTRHNAGRMAVERAALAWKAEAFSDKPDFHGRTAPARLDGEKILLVLPETFMNASGECVSAVARYYKITPENILIVHDDMDFSAGRLSFTPKGGSAGHNGVASVQAGLGTDAIARLRLGIGRPTPPLASEDYVLQTLSTDERLLADKMLEDSVKAMQDWAINGLDKAMNSWNGV